MSLVATNISGSYGHASDVNTSPNVPFFHSGTGKYFYLLGNSDYSSNVQMFSSTDQLTWTAVGGLIPGTSISQWTTAFDGSNVWVAWNSSAFDLNLNVISFNCTTGTWGTNRNTAIADSIQIVQCFYRPANNDLAITALVRGTPFFYGLHIHNITGNTWTGPIAIDTNKPAGSAIYFPPQGGLQSNSKLHVFYGVGAVSGDDVIVYQPISSANALGSTFTFDFGGSVLNAQWMPPIVDEVNTNVIVPILADTTLQILVGSGLTTPSFSAPVTIDTGVSSPFAPVLSVSGTTLYGVLCLGSNTVPLYSTALSTPSSGWTHSTIYLDTNVTSPPGWALNKTYSPYAIPKVGGGVLLHINHTDVANHFVFRVDQAAQPSPGMLSGATSQGRLGKSGIKQTLIAIPEMNSFEDVRQAMSKAINALQLHIASQLPVTNHQGQRLSNVGPPVAPDDAVTLKYLQAIYTPPKTGTGT